MRSAYVYYRIDPAREALAANRIDALLAALAPHCSLPPRRFARCDDPSTWMEVYEGIADFPAFGSALAAIADRTGCPEFTLGERHLECFVPAPARA